MFGVINKVFIGLLIRILNASNHVKYILLSIRKCMTQTTLINLHPNGHSEEFHYYLFAVKLDTCIGSCDTVNDLPNKVYFPKKTEDLNWSVFKMVTGINELKTLTRHISCECKCRLDRKKHNSDQWWNN